MNSRSSAAIILLLAFALCAAPGRAQAVSALNIYTDVLPPNPAPFEEVTINLRSYSENLDSTLIIWSVGGRNILSGTGKKSFTVKVGDTGSETSVVASIFLPSGTIEKRITLRPSYMTILWEATDSYVPPFYKGKALPLPDTEVKVVAMPEIKSGSSLVPGQNLVYSWKRDETNEPASSGYGKRYFYYVNDYLENGSSVEVTASTTNQKYSSRGSIDINTYEPKINFYIKDPVFGPLFGSALPERYRLSREEETLVATPYFISPKQIGVSFLAFNWFLNGSPLSPARKNAVNLKKPVGSSGASKLRLDIEHRDKIFQFASREMTIEF